MTFGFLRTVPGIGPILGLVMLYEIDAIGRFPEVGNFLSYARLVACTHESAGKVKGVGRPQDRQRAPEVGVLRGGVPDAAERSPAAKAWMQRQAKKRGAKKAHAILEAKIGRTVYHLWRKQVAFDAKKFLAS